MQPMGGGRVIPVGDHFVLLGWEGNFGARSGLSFQLVDVGDHEPQKATRNSLSWPLCFPSP